ncbi:MAG: sulfotransferase [Fidelibacterota bacterium]
MGSLEKVFIEPFVNLNKIDIEPIFLIGPPRSGTTIIAQWFIHYLDQPKTYISRITDLYPDAVLLLNTILNDSFVKNNIMSMNKYGQMVGLKSMAEGNRLWPWYIDSLQEKDIKQFRHIYDRTDYSIDNIITPNVSSFLNNVLKKQCLFYKTNLLINKSTHNTTKVLELKELFPKSRFIGIIRDGRYVTKSLLRARKEILGDKEKWWNTKPSIFNEIKNMKPHLSCARQWSGLLTDLENQFELLEEKDYGYIRYIDFINNPQKELQKLYKKFDLKYNLNTKYNYLLNAPKDVSTLFTKNILKQIEDEIGQTLRKWDYKIDA